MCVILHHCEVDHFFNTTQIIHILIQNISRSSTSSVLLDRRHYCSHAHNSTCIIIDTIAAMGSPEVVYVKQYELPNTAEHVMKYELCEICEHIVPDQVIAAQLFKGVSGFFLRIEVDLFEIEKSGPFFSLKSDIFKTREKRRFQSASKATFFKTLQIVTNMNKFLLSNYWSNIHFTSLHVINTCTCIALIY